MKKPKMDAVVEKLKTGANFSINRSEYISMTGVDIPQSKSYTEKKSALAKKANEYGYIITVIPEVIQFIKN